MMEIVQKGNPVLRAQAEEVPLEEISTEKFQNILEEMHSTLATQGDGVALAAPQIDISYRIFVISPKAYKNFTGNKPLVFINPEIVNHSKKKTWMEEGCLSVRWLYGKVRRYGQATVRAYNEKGELFEFGGANLIAQIFQHEIDHLNGVLFDDHAKDVHEIDPPETLTPRFLDPQE